MSSPEVDFEHLGQQGEVIVDDRLVSSTTPRNLLREHVGIVFDPELVSEVLEIVRELAVGGMTACASWMRE